MNNLIKTGLFTLVGLIILFFIWVFSYGQPLYDFGSSINADRFSDFGSFISGLLSVFVLYLLILTYDESKKQSFDNTFFNFLEVHESVVRGLKSNEHDMEQLNKTSKELFENKLCDTLDDSLKSECKSYEEKEQANDFFEILYRILHIQHKYKTKGDNAGVEKFFKDYKWRIGHFLRSYISLVELIHKNGHLNKEKKIFYADILKGRSSSDETRLVFYYILGQYYSVKEKIDKNQNPDSATLFEESKWKRIAKMLDVRQIFTEEEDALIWNKESYQPDWTKFKSIVTGK